MDFKIGQKVVCVDAHSPPVSWPKGEPRPELKEGNIYSITAIGISIHTDKPKVQLLEVPSMDEFGIPIWYQAKRFRPLVEKKTDISIFTAMLKETKHPAYLTDK